MKFSIPTLMVATTMMVPSVVDAWACGPSGFYGTRFSVVTPDQVMRQKDMIRRRQREIMSKKWKSFQDAYDSPRSEVINNDEKFQVALDVPGVLMEDIEITVQDDGAVLFITGMRKALDDDSSYVSKFSRQFSLDSTIDVEKFSANLQNGVLIVTAPKEMQRIEETIRKIPITEVEDAPTAQSEEEKTTEATKEKEEEALTAQDVPIQEAKKEKEDPEETSEDTKEE